MESLPRALASTTTLADVDPKLREQFRLTEASLAALRGELGEGTEPSQRWSSRVSNFITLLQGRPMLDEQTFQRATTEGIGLSVRLLIGDTQKEVLRTDVLSVEDGRLGDAIDSIARDAGFGVGPLRQLVVSRVLSLPRPTYRFDETQTLADQNEAALEVPPKFRVTSEGQPIFRRGEVLTAAAYDLYVAEMKHFNERAEWWRVWLRWSSLTAAVVAIAGALAGYTVLFAPRIQRNTARKAGAAAILLGTLAIACFGSAAEPSIMSGGLLVGSA
jgi:hypothetical protein